jgi:L-glyceraldehyde 3-phosphate reductase
MAPIRYSPPALEIALTYLAAEDRYATMSYRRSGRSGLKLPAVSLGLWHNFGDGRPPELNRAILRRAFDLGVTHFDLANNYGPPYGSAGTNFGRAFAADFRPYRAELIISTKAGYDMWPGPLAALPTPKSRRSRRCEISSRSSSAQTAICNHFANLK